MTTTILNQIDHQLQYITRLLESDIKKDSVIYDYFVYETKNKIFDWVTLKNFLTTTSFAKLNYLNEIVLRTEKFIELYNGFDDAIIKKFEKKFIFKSKFRKGYMSYDFRMILLNGNEIINLPNYTDDDKHTFLNKYIFNNYGLDILAEKCNNIRTVILSFYPSLAKTNIDNFHLRIFKNQKAFELFEKLKNSMIKYPLADYSFIYRTMLKDGLIYPTIGDSEFRHWLDTTFQIAIDKTKQLHNCTTPKKIQLYSEIKDRISL